MKPRKKIKARKEPANYEKHKYEDYLKFIQENPALTTTEMDTVYNQQEGPFIQTFFFQNTGLMIGFLHKEKTSVSMAATLDYLQEILAEDYKKLFSLILTDRGAEFEITKLFEVNFETGEFRTCKISTYLQKKTPINGRFSYIWNLLSEMEVTFTSYH